jgi:CRP-like cAMP-binding protein
MENQSSSVRQSENGRLQGLKNISWLTSRQRKRLTDGLVMSRVQKGGIIFDKKHSPESGYVLLSGVARLTCRNRKGDRTLVNMVAPGMIPGIPPVVSGINYSFRSEAVTPTISSTVSLTEWEKSLAK